MSIGRALNRALLYKFTPTGIRTRVLVRSPRHYAKSPFAPIRNLYGYQRIFMSTYTYQSLKLNKRKEDIFLCQPIHTVAKLIKERRQSDKWVHNLLNV
jgi:hypothetical protein